MQPSSDQLEDDKRREKRYNNSMIYKLNKTSSNGHFKTGSSWCNTVVWW